MDAQEELAFLRSVAASQLQTIKTLTLGCEKYGLTETTPIVRHLAAQDDEIERLRAELAERKATTPAPKPDCRTCAHVYTDMESYGCKRSTTIIVCIKGDGYVPSLPVRLYETGGE